MPIDMTGGGALTKSSPTWLKDFTERASMMPGGFKLDAAQFAADADGVKFVPGGTLVGRTKAERDASAGLGPVDAADDEVYFVRYDVLNAAKNNDCECVRPRAGIAIAETFLPASAIAALAVAGVRAAVAARYNLTRGAE